MLTAPVVEVASPQRNGSRLIWSDFRRMRDGRVDYFRLEVCSTSNFLDLLVDFEFLSDFDFEFFLDTPFGFFLDPFFDFLWVFLRVFFYPVAVALVWVVGISR